MVDFTESADVTITVTPANLGAAFAKMNSEEQAEFFQGVYDVTQQWPTAACFQWAIMRHHLEDMPQALSAFMELAEYGPDYQP